MRARIVVFMVLFFIVFGFAKGIAKKPEKILMIIASKNFRDEEFLIPKKYFEKQGYKVVVASSWLLPCKGMLGKVEVIPDKLVSDVKPENYVAIVFVGGTGCVEYFNNPVVKKLVREAYEEHKVIGAICLAPCILAKAGILKGKKATIWYSASRCLEENGAHYTGRDVEVDGRIVTAAGPFAAEKFAITVVDLIQHKHNL